MILDWHVNERESADLVAQFLPPVQRYLDAASADPVWLQLEEKSATGWNPYPPIAGFDLSMEDYLLFPELSPLAPLAMAYHLGERILVYPAGFIAVVQLNSNYSIARIS